MNIDDRLSHADPARSLDVSDDSLKRMLHAATFTPPGRTSRTVRPKRRGALIGGGLVAALALTVASPSIAEGIRFLAQTGTFGNDAATEEDNTEWVDVKASDFVEFALTVYPDYVVLPDSIDERVFATAVATRIHNPQFENPEDDTDSIYMQVTGVVQTYEYNARCLWMSEWMAAPKRSARADAAAEVLLESARWEATVSTDGGGIVDRLVELASDAIAGDGSLLKSEFSINCPTSPLELGK
jgi:hypothetical protein